jgi:adenosylmethionine-8-amino-7-oxononanoate aminotransferase
MTLQPSDRPLASGADWPFLASRSPRIIDAQGAWLICDDGRRILDAAGGAIVVNVGHGRQEVAEAMAGASAAFVVPTWRTPEREALVERLRAHWLPKGLHHVHLTCGGSEAMESAVKIALQHFAARGETDRTQIIARQTSYHGTTISMAAFSGHPNRKRGLEGFLPSFPYAPTPSPLHCPLGRHHPDAGQYYLDATRAVIEAQGAERVAALVIEAVTGSSGGAIVPPADYLAGIRSLCDEYGILLIVDEVMTGFGRTGAKFACDHWDLAPDILVAGKGLAGGYAAITGVFATPQVAAPIAAAGYDVMFHTFAALPSACAAADAVLQIIEREDLIAQVNVLGRRLADRLQGLLGQHPHVAEVRGMGLLQAVEIVRDRDSLEPFDAADRVTSRIVAQGLNNGAFFYPGGTGAVRDIICLGPPFVSTESEIDQMADILAASIGEVLC